MTLMIDNVDNWYVLKNHYTLTLKYSKQAFEPVGQLVSYQTSQFNMESVKPAGSTDSSMDWHNPNHKKILEW